MRAHPCGSGSISVLVALLFASAAAAAPASFKDSDQGRAIQAAAASQPPEQTYQELSALEADYAGDVDYDYLLGTAALDAGHSSAAVFALQRAVASAPSYSGARLDLARAYYAAGDDESARREFDLLQGESPPPAVADVIHQYLDAIDRRSGAYRPQFSALLEAGGGYDSNANGASDVNTFLNIPLNDRSQAQSSAYYGVSAAGQMSYPFRPRWKVLGDASAQQRNYPEAGFVNATVARLGAGLEHAADRITLDGIVSGTYVALDGERNNVDAALDLSAVYALAPSWQLGASARAAALRYASEVSAEDVDSYLGSLGLTHDFDSRPRLQLITSITGGHESAKEEDSPFGRNLIGGRVAALISPKSTMLASASIAVLHSNYGEFPGVITAAGVEFHDRDDTQYSARFTFDWKDVPARFWGIGTQVTYINNRSSLSLFEYDRVDLSLMLRREFR